MRTIEMALLAAISMTPALVRAEESQPPTGQMEAVTVTATRTEQRWDEVPQNATAVGREELDRRMSSTLPDALAGESGLLIQKTNSAGGSPFLRGLTGKEVLILVDGLRLNNALYRFGPAQYLNTIDPFAVERVEVVRGPGSVLYGSDALGGVINIITRKSDFEDAEGSYLEATGRYGSADRARILNASFNLQGERLGFWGGVTARDFGLLHGGGNVGEMPHTDFADTAYNFGAAAQLGNGMLSLSHFHLHQWDVPRSTFNSEEDRAKPMSHFIDPQRINLWSLAYEGDYDSAAFSEVRAAVQLQTQEEGTHSLGDLDEATRRPGKDSYDLWKDRMAGGSLQATSLLGSANRLTYGLEYYQEDVETEKRVRTGDETVEGFPLYPDGASYSTLGLFVQDSHEFADWLSVLAGLRWSRYAVEGEVFNAQLDRDINLDTYTSELTGSGSLLIGLAERTRLIATVSQGFRAPNLEDYFPQPDPALTLIEVPNADLEPTRSLNYELGLKREGESYRFSAFAFAALYKDFIARQPTTVDGAAYLDANSNGMQDEGELDYQSRQNTGKGKIIGTEIDFSANIIPELRLFGNYSYYRGRDDESGKPLRRIPPQQAILGIEGEHPNNRGFIRYWAHMSGAQKRLSGGDIDDSRIPEGGTPGWVTHNLLLGARPSGPVALGLRIENVTDRRYKTHGSGVFGPGTNVMLEMEVTAF